MLRTSANRLLVAAAPRRSTLALASSGKSAAAAIVGAGRTSAYATMTASSTPGSGQGVQSLPSLANIEASWHSLTPQEQEAVFHHLEGLQKKNWKELTLDEKKASYFVSFGPHGPRAPLHPPGSTPRLLIGIAAAIATSLAIFAGIRSLSPEAPRTMTKEWQEASMEYAKEQRMDPFTGPASDKPNARTLVQSK